MKQDPKSMVKRLMKEKKKNLRNEEILLHPSFSELLTNEAGKLLESWLIPRRTVRVIKGEPGLVACTDNKELLINACHENIRHASRGDAFKLAYGYAFHEAGHVLFTSYSSMYYYSDKLRHGMLWPADPKVEGELKSNLEEMLEYIKDPVKAKNLDAMVSILSNSIEDPRIEHLLKSYCSEFTKFIQGLDTASKVREKTNFFETLEEIRARCETDAEVLNQMIFTYANIWEIAGYKEEYEEDDLYKMLMEISDHIYNAVYSEKSSEFYTEINRILVTCWPVYKNYLDQKQDERQQQDTGNNQEKDSENENGGSEGGSGSSDVDISEEIKTDLDASIKGLTPMPSESSSETGSGADSKDISALMKAKAMKDIGYEKTDAINSYGDGYIAKEEKYIDNDWTSIDMEALVNRISKDAAQEEVAENRKKMLEETANNLDYTDINKNVNIELFRPAVTEKMRMEFAKDSVCEISNIGCKTAKKILKHLPQESEPITLKNRVVGSRFDASAVARNDLKYFSKTSRPEEGPSLVIGLVVDESGSMGGSREQSARAAAIALHSCALKLNVPICIYGHTADMGMHGDVSMYRYTDYDYPEKDDKYRLMAIQARGNNRDAVPVQYVAERLLKSDCDKKLLIIISDGQPNAAGYYGTAADKDLQHTVKKYSKKGITIVAAAIGGDRENIKRIYSKERYLDISDLNALPTELLKIVKQNMR